MITIQNFNTRFFIADVTPLLNEETYIIAYKNVSLKRQEKADKYKFKKDKALCIGAGLLLDYALLNVGIKKKNLNISYGENGKPYLTDYTDVFFNISHSGNFAVCAVSQKEIGCDIEKTDEINLKTAERYFQKSEYDAIMSENDETANREMFFRYWTLKESFIKLIGKGLALPLDAFQIKLDGENISLNIPDADISKFNTPIENIFFKEFNCVNNYKCSVCSY